MYSLGEYKNNIFLLLSSIFFGAIGQVLMKTGASNADINNITSLFLTMIDPFVILGLLSYSLSSAIWLVVLTRLPLSMAYPFGAISYILVIIASLLAGEYIRPIRYLGVILITSGILVIGNATQNYKA